MPLRRSKFWLSRNSPAHPASTDRFLGAGLRRSRIPVAARRDREPNPFALPACGSSKIASTAPRNCSRRGSPCRGRSRRFLCDIFPAGSGTPAAVTTNISNRPLLAQGVGRIGDEPSPSDGGFGESKRSSQQLGARETVAASLTGATRPGSTGRINGRTATIPPPPRRERPPGPAASRSNSRSCGEMLSVASDDRAQSGSPFYSSRTGGSLPSRRRQHARDQFNHGAAGAEIAEVTLQRDDRNVIRLRRQTLLQSPALRRRRDRSCSGRVR